MYDGYKNLFLLFGDQIYNIKSCVRSIKLEHCWDDFEAKGSSVIILCLIYGELLYNNLLG